MLEQYVNSKGITSTFCWNSRILAGEDKLRPYENLCVVGVNLVFTLAAGRLKG
jgi:hypothetical protein